MELTTCNPTAPAIAVGAIAALVVALVVGLVSLIPRFRGWSWPYWAVYFAVAVGLFFAGAALPVGVVTPRCSASAQDHALSAGAWFTAAGAFLILRAVGGAVGRYVAADVARDSNPKWAARVYWLLISVGAGGALFGFRQGLVADDHGLLMGVYGALLLDYVMELLDVLKRRVSVAPGASQVTATTPVPVRPQTPQAPQVRAPFALLTLLLMALLGRKR